MKLEAYAKVNYTLQVLGRRSDGYHDLKSVVLPVELHDTVEVVVDAGGGFSSNLPYDDDLCIAACRALAAHAPALAGKGVRIAVEKRIPVGGGLGGGSADAAAVLRALNEICALELSPEELAAVGADVGSDVPALVLCQHYRQPVLMEGRGERVSLLRGMRGSPARRGIVMAIPHVHSSTREVYARCLPGRGHGPNDLEGAAVALHPEIGEAKEFLRRAGAEDVRMTGSGAAVFGFYGGGDITPSGEYDIIRTNLLCDCPVV